VAQLELQALLLQTWPDGHAVVQFPQWVASDETHMLLQVSAPDWHWQVPPWQVMPPLQTLPQAPQFWGSVVAFTHAVPQVVCPAGQVAGGGPPDPDFAQLARASAQPRRATKIDLVMAY